MIATQRRADREAGAAGVGGQRDEISCWESLLQDGGQESPSASALEALRFRVGAWLGCPHFSLQAREDATGRHQHAPEPRHSLSIPQSHLVIGQGLDVSLFPSWNQRLWS